MKLSIITVCYNAETTILATLGAIENSILNAHKCEVEYIIIDGGSKDQTVNIIKKFCERNMYAKFISEQDKGIYDAYNKGLSFATGEYVWFVNADDVIRDDAVDVISTKLNDCSEIEVFCFSISRVDRLKSLNITSVRDEKKPIKVLSPVCHTPGIIWRKTTLEKINGFDISYKICADFKALQLLLPNCKMKGFKDIVIDMYLGGISSQYKFELLKAREQLGVILTSSFNFVDKVFASIRILIKLFRNLFVNPIWRKIK